MRGIVAAQEAADFGGNANQMSTLSYQSVSRSKQCLCNMSDAWVTAEADERCGGEVNGWRCQVEVQLLCGSEVTGLRTAYDAVLWEVRRSISPPHSQAADSQN